MRKDKMTINGGVIKQDHRLFYLLSLPRYAKKLETEVDMF